MAPSRQQELLRLVCALSSACRADSNVLKDAQLVDVFESQAKAILQSRRQKQPMHSQQQRRKSTTPVDAPTISPQRAKLIKKLADANGESDLGGVTASKRRKLSFEAEVQQRAASPLKAAMPPHLLGKLDFASKDPAAETDALAAHAAASSSLLSVSHASVVDRMGQRRGAVSPQLFYKPDACSLFQSLDRASVGVDLSASLASTVVSTSAGYYDDMYDELGDSRYQRARSPGMDSHGRHSPSSELTQSVGSIDWLPSDDEDDELLDHSKSVRSDTTSLSFDAHDDASVDVSPKVASSTEVVMQVLYGIMHHDQKYKWLVNPENQARVAKLVAYRQRQQQEEGPDRDEQRRTSAHASASTELRAQVEGLVCENLRIQRENARLLEVSQMSVCDVEEQKQRVHELRAKLQAAAATATRETRSDAETRLAATEELLQAQESIRREAESVFASELRAKADMVAALKNEVAAKDSEISRLVEQIEEMSATFVSKSHACSSNADNSALSSPSGLRRLSLRAQKAPMRVDSAEPVDADESMILHLREVNLVREAEVQRLRNVVMEKDREICNLYMHLSTKKALVDEIASRFAQQVETIAAARGEAASLSRADMDLNLDMFLFKNAVEKQKAMDELAAALGVMEREVELLEGRVETLESENYTLKLTHEDVTCTLESANSELLRVSAENELMESSLKEKQTRIRNLMLYLEEKEDQVMRLKDAAEQRLCSAPLSAPSFASYAGDTHTY